MRGLLRLDFKRIARIFIIAFGLLNLYLINGIVEREDVQNVSTQPMDSSILSSMSSSNITLPENLADTSIEDENIYPLQINMHNFLENALEESELNTGTLDDEGIYYTSFPSNRIELEGNPREGYTEKDIERISNFVASEVVLFGEDYRYYRYEQEGNRFFFYQEIDGIPIADGTSEVILFADSEGDIISYQQTYAGPATRQGDPLNIISGTRAVEILFLNNEIRQGSTVRMPTLAYRRALHLEDLSMYSPIWVIVVEYASERNTFRVDAVNGTIIRQVSSTPTDGGDDSSGEEDEETNDEIEIEEDTES